MNGNEFIKNEHQILHKLLDYAINNETKLLEESNNKVEVEKDECAPPKICHEFQTARLFLSHFGFLNFESEKSEHSGNNELIVLDSTMPGFSADLEYLDHTSTRTCDTAHIFYVKSGQTSVESILSNVVSYLVNSFFTINIVGCKS